MKKGKKAGKTARENERQRQKTRGDKKYVNQSQSGLFSVMVM